MEYIKIVKLDLSTKISTTITSSEEAKSKLLADIERRKRDIIPLAGTLIYALLDITIALQKQGVPFSSYITDILNRHSYDEAFEIILDSNLKVTKEGNVNFKLHGVMLWHIENRNCTKGTSLRIQTYYNGWYTYSLQNIIDLIIKESF